MSGRRRRREGEAELEARQRVMVASINAAMDRIAEALAVPSDERLESVALFAGRAVYDLFFEDGREGVAFLMPPAVERLRIFQISYGMLIDRIEGATTERARA
jgi:hypothetical protein